MENEVLGLKGVVHSIENRYLYILRWGTGYASAGTWGKEYCTRTGKTYPELIKALEKLPKEGDKEMGTSRRWWLALRSHITWNCQ